MKLSELAKIINLFSGITESAGREDPDVYVLLDGQEGESGLFTSVIGIRTEMDSDNHRIVIKTADRIIKNKHN